MDELETLTAAGVPRRRPRREDVRTELLSAALAVFGEVGYVAARVDTIADRAGFTKGAIYSNFGSKQGLFAALLGDRLAAITADILAGADEFDSLDELVRYSAGRLADQVLDEQNWHILVTEFTVQAARDPEVAEAFRSLRRSRRDLLAEALAARAALFGGSSDVAHYLVPSVRLLATVNGLALELAADPDAMKRDDIVATLTGVLRSAVG